MSHIQAAGQWMPLTLPQLDFWEEFLFHPDEPVSTVAHCIVLKGTLDHAAMSAAISRTVAEAEVLWVRFRDGGKSEAPEQFCDPACRPPVEIFDFSDREDPMAEARRLMESDVKAPLDLRVDRLSAQFLIRLSEDHHLWYIRAHHIIVDGFGLSLVEHRCAQLYRHFRDGEDAGAPFHSLASFIAEEEAYRQSHRHAADRAFWQAYLEGAADLPVIYKGDESYGASTFEGGSDLDDTLPDQLRQTAMELGIGWPDLLVLTAGLYFHETLPRQKTADGDVLTLWLPFMSRWGSVGAHMPGMLVNILPFFVRLERGETVSAYLKRSAAILRKQRMHGRYRIEQIATDREMPEGSRFYFSPLINVLPFSAPAFPDLQVSRHILANGPGEGYSLTFRGADDGSDLTLRLDADSAVLDGSEFERHKNALPHLLRLALSPAGLGADARALVSEVQAEFTGA
ncbi:condensation domain-containing protein [Rhizobium sp. G187]|uniref:condensation domain-containing protein n=1 Tax=Rhizobium sp. G187 TaxID=3451352 RepID=UPI003EE5F41B